MRRSSVVAVATALTLASSLALAAGGTPRAIAFGKAHALPSQSTLSTLYDQSANDSGIAILSQNFEAAYDTYDSSAADDFTVPAGTTWMVNELDVFGQYFNGVGPATSETLTLYKNVGGLPGAAVASVTAIGADNGTGSFVFKFHKGVKLKPGTYWVSVQVNMDFGVGGEWGWENQFTVEGNPAAWTNPMDGFATGCTGWSVETACIPDGQGDHMFIVKGTAM